MWVLSVLSGFVVTNFDTFLIMLILQNHVRDRTHKAVILLGFFVGLMILVGFAYLGLNLTQALIESHVNIILAIGFMVLAILSLRHKSDTHKLNNDLIPQTVFRLGWMIVGIYVLSGSDNILVYMGLLSTMSLVEQLLMLAAHLGLLSLLFLMSQRLYAYSNLDAFLTKHQGRILSLLFVYLAIMVFMM